MTPVYVPLLYNLKTTASFYSVLCLLCLFAAINFCQPPAPFGSSAERIRAAAKKLLHRLLVSLTGIPVVWLTVGHNLQGRLDQTHNL